MKIVVVMAAVNCLKYSQEAVASLVGHDRLIFIDNASNDGTREWSESINAHIIRNSKNIGVPESWNVGIWTALRMEATHIIVLNNDICCAPDTIPALIQWSDLGVDLPTVRAVKDLDTPRQHKIMMPGDFCGFLVTGNLMDKIGWFDEKFFPAYCEDLDFSMRVREANLIQGSCYDALVTHAVSRSIAEGGVKLGKAWEDNTAYFFRKWGITHEAARQKLIRTKVNLSNKL